MSTIEDGNRDSTWQQGDGFNSDKSGQSSQSGQQGGDFASRGQQQQFDRGQSGSSFGGSGTDGRLVEQIREHMDVLADDGEKLGRVDSVDGDRIKLTREDSNDGQHHYIQASDVAGIENDQVMLHSGARALPGNDGS